MTRQQRRSRHNVPAARALREMHTPAESLLWEAIRDRQLAGLKFRRQHPIGSFVADFCCPDRRLIVELDGGIHAARVTEDAEREALLTSAGYTVLRFPNETVLTNLSAVLEAITDAASDHLPCSGRPPLRAGPW
jgi:very-short-patch-repair endonuclease